MNKCRPNLSDMVPQKSNGLNPLQRGILLAVTYADVFDYPLTVKEIHRYCGIKASFNHVYAETDRFRLLNHVGDFYTLPGREALIAIRTRREEVSARLWPRAIRYGKAVAELPFIRMLAVTGSLAVNNTDDPADIDYLIVTEPGRLWTCRALVLALGKLAARQGLNLCPNYLITTRALEFQEHTLYVAHELTQMIPLSGLEVYAEIRRRNVWVADYLPNADGMPLEPAPVDWADATPRLRPVFETLARTPPGAWFERWEMERKIRKLSREQGFSAESAFSADVCKGHDQRHQSRTQRMLDSKVSRLLRAQDLEILDSEIV
ncbi:MAG: hypothetical protein WBL25_19435 [Anaerolineales bacterium]